MEAGTAVALVASRAVLAGRVGMVTVHQVTTAGAMVAVHRVTTAGGIPSPPGRPLLDKKIADNEPRLLFKEANKSTTSYDILDFKSYIKNL